MFDKSVAGRDNNGERYCSEGYPISRESTGSSRMRATQQQDYSQLTIAASESSIGNHHEDYPNPTQEPNSPPPDADIVNQAAASLREQLASTSMMESPSEDKESKGLKKSKSKKILRMLKGPGKSVRSLKKTPNQDSNNHIAGANSGSIGVPSEPHVRGKKSPKSSSKSFSLPNVFHKQLAAPELRKVDCELDTSSSTSLSRKFENMAWILRQLENSCAAIEKNLTKTFSQKMADWALYPWSASKDNALASVTQAFRSELRLINNTKAEKRFPILNPIDPTQLLTSVDADECFILPSAHFPLLLCFNVEEYVGSPKKITTTTTKRDKFSGSSNADTLYRTKVEVLSLRSTLHPEKVPDDSFAIQGTIAGITEESGAR